MRALRATARGVLAVAMAAGLWSCGESDSPADTPATPGTAGNTVGLTFSMQMPTVSRAETPKPAELISTLRIVIVDTGVDTDGETVAPPQVEVNKYYTTGSLREETGFLLTDSKVQLRFEEIRADRVKKIYLMVNAEPNLQSYLDMRLADGTPVASLADNNIFVPGDDGVSPIDNAVFRSPQGSYTRNDITTGEELLTPYTACHTFAIPTIEEIAKEYPSISATLTYPLPSELLVVRAVNKIWLEFINRTYQQELGSNGLELLVRQWTLSDVNGGDDYLFGHVGDNGGLFNGYRQDLYDNVNAPWMQWVFEEALRSQTGSVTPQWLTVYDLPAGSSSRTLAFDLGESTGNPLEGTPRDVDGVVIGAPNNEAGVSVTTENLPVYFGESHSGNPQTYEMTFTVWQREKGATTWANPHTYSVRSTSDDFDGGNFHLLSLFRNTNMVMTAIFVTGRSGVDVEVEVHPYGSVELQPGFGL